ncbi:MAG TPA: oxidoreductase [Candidatus Binataceae bacterium]|nr:oxidoreductase [Candidatus Binataceae bacterium]
MSANGKWTADDLPDLSGKNIIVTGGNSGIGYAAALQFARKGASVILACRNLEKAGAAATQIKAAYPAADAAPMALDLASLQSIREFAASFRAGNRTLDILCNNAGVMALPYSRTADGFEMQLGVNHLGHFALTGLLLEPLLAAGAARVVNVSSGAHRMGSIRFDDLNWEHGYSKWRAYGQSKLANLLFTLELERRIKAHGAKLMAVACHPGYAATNLQAAGPKLEGAALIESIFSVTNRYLAQSAAMGALPTLYAATTADVRGGEYFGPDGIAEMWGYPTRVKRSAAAQDLSLAARLWTVSEAMTKVRFNALPA